MRDVRKVKDTVTILEARSLLRSQTAQELELARAAEAERRGQADQARNALDAAFGAWSGYLAGSSLDPSRLGLLATAIDVRTGELRAREAAAKAASEAADVKQAEYATRNAEVAHAKTLHRRARREQTRAEEQASLDINDDRIAFQWSRK